MYSIFPGWCMCFLSLRPEVNLKMRILDTQRAQHFHIKVYPEGEIAENGTFIAGGSAVQYVAS